MKAHQFGSLQLESNLLSKTIAQFLPLSVKYQSKEEEAEKAHTNKYYKQINCLDIVQGAARS